MSPLKKKAKSFARNPEKVPVSEWFEKGLIYQNQLDYWEYEISAILRKMGYVRTYYPFKFFC